MFCFPEIGIEDSARIADWVELNTVFFGQCSRGSVEDAAYDGSLLGFEGDTARDTEYVDGDNLTAEDALPSMSEGVWRELDRRVRRLGRASYLKVTRDEAQLHAAHEDWTSVPSIGAMLLADLAPYYDKAGLPSTCPFRDLFETIVRCAFQGHPRSKSLRFGVPVDKDWPGTATHPKDRLSDLGVALGLTAGVSDVDDYIESTGKDFGLDVVTRIEVAGDKPAFFYILTQCATGENWRYDKRGEPSVAMWNRLVSWDAPCVRAVAVPYRLTDRELKQRSAEFEGAVVLDRVRIASGAPDKRIPEWCSRGLRDWSRVQLTRIPVRP